MNIISYTKEITWLPFTNHGWGNGYVGVLEGHPWYGADYMDIPNIDIHYGLTYGEYEEHEGIKYYVVGFDTAHHNDNMEKWTKSAVEEETKRLKQQAIDACK